MAVLIAGGWLFLPKNPFWGRRVAHVQASDFAGAPCSLFERGAFMLVSESTGIFSWQCFSALSLTLVRKRPVIPACTSSKLSASCDPLRAVLRSGARA